MSEKPATVPPHMVPEAEALFERLGYPRVSNEGNFDRVNEPPPAPLPIKTKWKGLPDGPAMDRAMDPSVCNLNILAIDIGTTTGWALGMRDGALHSGSESFAPKRNDGPGQRWLKFAAFLGERARQAGEIQAIYYELVLRHTAVQAAHVYGGFEAHLQAWADRNRVRLVGVPVPVIKKSATGKGNANKDAMVAAMRGRGHRVVDDNHADALALLEFARKQEA